MPFQLQILKFVRLANVENEKNHRAVKPGFQLPRRNFRHLQVRHRGFLSAHAAEFIIVKSALVRWILPQTRAIRILAQLCSRNFHRQRTNNSQAPDKIVGHVQ